MELGEIFKTEIKQKTDSHKIYTRLSKLDHIEESNPTCIFMYIFYQHVTLSLSVFSIYVFIFSIYISVFMNFSAALNKMLDVTSEVQ